MTKRLSPILFLGSVAVALFGFWQSALAAPTPIVSLDASTLGLSNGANISSWSNNGITYTQASSTSQVVYNTTGFNGHPAVYFNGVGASLDAGNPSSFNNALQNGSFTVIVAIEASSSVQYGTIFAKSPGGGPNGLWLMEEGNVASGENYGGYPTSAAEIGAVGTPQILTYTFSRIDATHGVETIYVNGNFAAQATSTVPAWEAGSDFTLGGVTNGNDWFYNGNIADVQVYGSVLSDSDRLSAETAIATENGLSFSSYNPSVTLTYVGNSIVRGDATNGQTVAVQTQSLLQGLTGNNYYSTNLGIDGATWSDLSTLVDEAIRPGALNILYVYEDTNALSGLSGTSSAAAVQAQAAAYYAARKAAGWNYVIGATDMPTGLDDNTTRLELNALRRQPDNNRILIDLANDPDLGDKRTSQDLTTYFADANTHPNTAGDAIIANYIETVVEKIVSPSTLFSSISATPTDTAATITWTTDFDSSSMVNYGLTSSYSTSSVQTDTLTTVNSHTSILTNLTPCTLYHYQVQSTDYAGTTATSSDQTFTTACDGAGSLYNNGQTGSGGGGRSSSAINNAFWQAYLQSIGEESTTSGTSTAAASTLSTTTTASPTVTTFSLPGCPQGFVCSLTTPSASSMGSTMTSPGLSTTTPSPSTTTLFTRDLYLGITGPDVKELQQYLNSHDFAVSSSGSGSPGHETTTFGTKTQSDLEKFQKAHNIRPSIGYFGAITRAFVNSTI